MNWRPQLNVCCGRCGKPRGLVHDCVSNSRRKQTIRPVLSFGKCPKCKKTVTSPLTHLCAPKSDFKRRKAAHDKRQRAAARKKRQQDKHDYTECSDNECPRSLCVAYKKGWKGGDEAGFKRGWEQCYPLAWQDGYAAGYAQGLADCPKPHV